MTAKPITGFDLSLLIWKIPIADLPRRERAILRALADHYPNIWPSVKNVGAATGYSRSHTAAALRRLEKHFKLITVKNRFRKDGSQQPSEYVIDIFAVQKMAFKKGDACPETGGGLPEIGG